MLQCAIAQEGVAGCSVVLHKWEGLAVVWYCTSGRGWLQCGIAQGGGAGCSRHIHRVGLGRVGHVEQPLIIHCVELGVGTFCLEWERNGGRERGGRSRKMSLPQAIEEKGEQYARA